MGKQLKKLEKVVLPAGLELSGLLAEIAEEVAKLLPPQIDPDTLVEQTSLRVSAEVAHKLSEVTESIAGMAQRGQVDQDALIKGVAALLQPQLKAAGDRAAAEAIAAAKQATQQVLADLEAKQAKQPSEDGSNVAVGQMSLLNWVSANTDGIAKLIEAFRPKPTLDDQMISGLVRIFRMNDVVDKLKSGERDVNKLTQIYKSTAPPAAGT